MSLLRVQSTPNVAEPEAQFVLTLTAEQRTGVSKEQAMADIMELYQ
jgi:hypothetical protein